MQDISKFFAISYKELTRKWWISLCNPIHGRGGMGKLAKHNGEFVDIF
jgi:hypothetical protein